MRPVKLKVAQPVLLLVGALWLAPCVRPALAQAEQPAPASPEPSDAERLAAARAEQAAERAREREDAGRIAREAEAEAERARLEKIGVAPEEGTLLERGKGFFVQLEAWSADISGPERTVARVADIVTTATTAEQADANSNGLPEAFSLAAERTLGLEYSSSAIPRVTLGWRTGSGASLRLRYLGLSSSASVAAESTLRLAAATPGTGDVILGGIDAAGIENVPGAYASNPAAFARPFGSPRAAIDGQLHGADSVTASGDLSLARLDLLWGRTGIARRRMELSYHVGLSLAEVERTEAATFSWRSFERARVLANALFVESVEASSKAQGIGPAAGIAARFGLTANRRWSARLGLDLAAVQASHELAFRDVGQLTEDQLPAQPLRVFQDVVNGGTSNVITILDLEAAIEGRFGERFRLALGWTRSTWMDALVEERFPDPDNLALLSSDQVDVTLGGPFVRVGIYF